MVNRRKIRDGVPAQGSLGIADNWIYIQEPNVFAGRLQIFKDWSKFLVADPDKVWIGVEYFCYESDDIWILSDEEIGALAKRELTCIGIIDEAEVIDSTVHRMPKIYPAYFGIYSPFGELRDYLDLIDNLFLIGRNGMHKYNNQDHSMLTAMTAVENMTAGRIDKSNIWAVNTEMEYQDIRSEKDKPAFDELAEPVKVAEILLAQERRSPDMSAALASLRVQEDLVVDLDGTLVLADTFQMSVLEAVRSRPANMLVVLKGLSKGRAFCKSVSAKAARLNAANLPYNQPLLEYLRRERAAGRRVILATGADRSIASGVAEHLECFDEVIASDGCRNLSGPAKLAAVRELLGDAPYTYAGNSRADLALWREARAAILVGAPKSCGRELQAAGIEIEQEFQGARTTRKALLGCLRSHQWSKNILVFIPAVLSHQVRNAHVLLASLVAFLALCFCASALYVVNDLLDIQADRQHPRKRLRPLASGQVSVASGIGLGALLLAAAGALCLFLPMQTSFWLAVYATGSLTYSLKLKRVLFMDVVCLGLLYVSRVLYGGAATGINISIWTLAFSLFLFTSLATMKRLAELRRIDVSVARTEEYRGYKAIDVTQLSSLTSAAGYVAVLVLALYINSPEVTLLYKHAQGLWFLCPILIYWLSRLSIIANRGYLDDDPVSFALKDRATWFVGMLAFIVLVLST